MTAARTGVSRHPQERIDRALAMAAGGETAAEIGRRLGVPSKTVSGWITRSRGGGPRKPHGQEWSEEARRAILADWEAGVTVEAICQRHRINRWSLKGFVQGAVHRGQTARPMSGEFVGLDSRMGANPPREGIPFRVKGTNAVGGRITHYCRCREDAERVAALHGQELE